MKLGHTIGTFVLCSFLASAPAGAEYVFEHQLFGNDVQALAARDGALYWATSAGLVVMNRADSSVVVHRRRDRGVPSDSLHSLAFDASGNLWCGTEAGAAILGPTGRWDRLSTFDGLPHPRVHTVELSNGEMLLGTSEGYVTVRDLVSKEVTSSCTTIDPCVDTFPSIDILVTFRRSSTEQWFGTVSGPVLVRTAGDSTEVITLTAGLTNARVNAFAETASDFWVGTDNGAYWLDEAQGRWVPTTGLVDPDGGAGDARAFLDTSRGLLCASRGARRVFAWRDTAWVRVGATFPSTAPPQALVLDESGGVWCGTGGGVQALDASGTAWSAAIAVPGLTANGSIWSVATGSRPETWVGYENVRESAVWTGDRWAPITEASTSFGYERRPTQGLLVDQSGAIWFGHCCCTGDGCFTDRAEGDDPTDLSWMRIPARNVRAIARNDVGHVFLGSGAEDPAVIGAGLYFWRSSFGADSVVVIPTGGSHREGTVTGLAFDPEGALWVGYRNRGVHRWEYGASPLDSPATDRSTFYTAASGGLIGDEVLAIAADGDRMWIGTTRGVTLYEDGDHRGDFGTFYFENPLVTALAVTADRSVWAGTPAGITRLVPNALGTFDVETYHFPALPNESVKGLAARGNEVWVATSRGVAIGRPVESDTGRPVSAAVPYPNPFRAGSLDGLRLADIEVSVDIDVYDASGALVASSAAVPPGAVAWDGLVEGALASPGIYVVVARSPTFTVRSRVAVLR